MKAYFRTIPKHKDHWRKTRDYTYIIHNLNHNIKTTPEISHHYLSDQVEFITAMLKLENLMYPDRTQQIFSDLPTLEQITTTHTFAIYRVIHSNNIPQAFTEIQGLPLTLDEVSKAYYNNRTIIYESKTTPTWENIFKLLAFKEVILNQETNEKDNRFLNFYTALVDKNIQNVNQAFANIVEDPTIKTKLLQHLTKFFKSNTEKQMLEIKEQIIEINQDLENLLKLYTDQNARHSELLARYDYLAKVPEKDISQNVIKYLSKNPYIEQILIQDSHLKLYYVAPIIYYDEDALDHLLATSRSASKKKFLNILKERKYQLYTRCVLHFYPNTFRIATSFIGTDDDFIGHPHIDKYSCLGNHPSEIRKWFETGDYIGAIDQISVAVLNLNLYDGIVLDSLIETLKTHDFVPTFRDTTTGEFVSFNDIQL